MLSVATALGADHPDAAAWLKANGLRRDAIQRHPGRVWAVALDSNDSRRYVRPKYAQYLPPDTRWRNRDGNGEAEARLPNGGVIVFKSVDQGRDGFQGAAVDLVHFDEEPMNQAVVNEAITRTVDRQGRIIITMTPLSGKTWIYDRWVQDPPPDVAVTWIHGADNPHLPHGALEKVLAQFGEHERAARARGEFVAMEGRVFEFYRHLHVVEAFDPPADWPRIRAIDFGTRNPFACVWIALDPSDSTVHVYRLHYQAEWTLRQHAERIHALSAGEDISFTVADPEDRGARLTLAQDFDMPTVPADKDIRKGLNLMAQLFRPDAEGRPHLLVHDSCPELVRELEGYIWDTKSTTRTDQPDKPLKRNDHAIDCTRYGCMALKPSM